MPASTACRIMKSRHSSSASSSVRLDVHDLDLIDAERDRVLARLRENVLEMADGENVELEAGKLGKRMPAFVSLVAWPPLVLLARRTRRLGIDADPPAVEADLDTEPGAELPRIER